LAKKVVFKFQKTKKIAKNKKNREKNANVLIFLKFLNKTGLKQRPQQTEPSVISFPKLNPIGRG
jgi:hypothetical protein